jgi:hypothetical protein
MQPYKRAGLTCTGGSAEEACQFLGRLLQFAWSLAPAALNTQAVSPSERERNASTLVGSKIKALQHDEDLGRTLVLAGPIVKL